MFDARVVLGGRAQPVAWVSTAIKYRQFPGPWGLPWLGAVLGFRSTLPATYAAWRKAHGDVFMYSLGKSAVVVTSGR
jgi:hypothetical protein